MSEQRTIGVIRVLTSSDPGLVRNHGLWIESHTPFKVMSECIADQPDGIHDAATEALAVPKVVALAKRFAEEDHVDAIMISCAADPGIGEVRACVSIPVVGAGSAAAVEGLALGGSVGVLGLTADVPPAMTAILGNRIVAANKPQRMETTNDLRTAWGREAAIAAGQKLVDEGARIIVEACTGMNTIGLAPVLRASLRIPVVDPVAAAAGVLLGLLA